MSLKKHWDSYAKSERGAHQLGFMFSAGLLTLYAGIMTAVIEYAGGVSWKPIYRATMPYSVVGYLLMLAIPLIVLWGKRKDWRYLSITAGLVVLVYLASNFSVFANAAKQSTRELWQAVMSIEQDPQPQSLYRLLETATQQQRDLKKPWLGRVAPEYAQLERIYVHEQ